MDRYRASSNLERALPGRRLFRFRARGDGGRKGGYIRAESRELALVALSRRRWVPLDLQEVQPTSAAPPTAGGRPAMAALLFRQLSVLYRSGVPLAQGVEVLRGQAPDAETWRILTLVRADLRSGRSVSASIRRRPELFPPWCATSLVAAVGALIALFTLALLIPLYSTASAW